MNISRKSLRSSTKHFQDIYWSSYFLYAIFTK